MPELDSLRGIAILAVVFFHEFGFSYGPHHLSGLARWFVAATMSGWAGVNLFFVLSGFLITGILLDAKGTPDYYRRFYVRRALRILPAYYTVLILLAILPRTGMLWHRSVGWPFITLSFFYLSNLVGLFGVASQYTVLWTLAVEEQFYIAWPAVVRALSRRGVLAAAIFIVAACPVFRGALYLTGFNYSVGYTWLVADGLGAGAILAVLTRERLSERSQMRRFTILCLLVGIGILVLGAPFGVLRSATLLGVSLRPTGINITFLGLLSAALLLGSGPFKWLARRPLLQFFGWISYGLYLIHMMVFDFVDFLISHYFPTAMHSIPARFDLMILRFAFGMCMAVTIAVLSRIYFEAYFLRLKDRWARSPRSQPQPPVAAAASR
jgi:peptidoglycan/LPS O-acetylase OafA/YrhL